MMVEFVMEGRGEELEKFLDRLVLHKNFTDLVVDEQKINRMMAKAT